MPERQYRELRRLALAGKLDQVRAGLHDWLQAHPDDQDILDEWQRLERGEVLRMTESPEQKRLREHQEQQQKLTNGLQAYLKNKACLRQWDSVRLAEQRKLCYSLPPELSTRRFKAYRRSLQHELRRRRRPLFRKLMWGGIATGSVLILVGSILFFQQEAQKDDRRLRQAIRSRDASRVMQALSTADTGANALFYPRIRESIDTAQLWLHQQALHFQRIHAMIEDMEQGRGRSHAADLAQRASLERRLRELSWNASSLRERWNSLLEKEKNRLSYEKAPVLQALSAPLPPFPILTGIVDDDVALLNQQLEAMEALEALYAETAARFSLSENLLAPIQRRAAELSTWLEEIEDYRKAISRLPQAKSYSHYRSILAGLHPRYYRPACELMLLQEALPDESWLQTQMQEYSSALEKGMLDTFRQHLLESAPSFSSRYPANMEQEHTMQDVFVSVPLRKVFYELSHPTYGVCLSDNPPVVDEAGVHFIRSRHDPDYRPDAPHRCTWWPGAFQVMMRKIDTTGLLKASGIDRSTFFSSTYLPKLLSQIANYRQATCPALAQAYLYDRVLTVMQQHKPQALLGINYAPGLRADIRSFTELRDKLGFPLEGGCWLQRSSKAQQAESAYSRWFQEHCPRHYEREIARNFKLMISVGPRYLGYVDDRGNLHAIHPVNPDTPLWYLSQGRVRLSPSGRSLEAPQPYSPVFSLQKSI